MSGQRITEGISALKCENVKPEVPMWKPETASPTLLAQHFRRRWEYFLDDIIAEVFLSGRTTDVDGTYGARTSRRRACAPY